ncbi:pheromone-processing carboxypeptidase KEX1-like [Capsicum annuum]|uniref:pheromone-processing carboxypeptidase KEX1-like n=1 Tax=Capsicum annuum TaxID=4072 RepID=UPI001FB0E8DC|nr:pheromone-processing carboxypeptidase KEX1-like [Capsicum annuum]
MDGDESESDNYFETFVPNLYYLELSHDFHDFKCRPADVSSVVNAKDNPDQGSDDDEENSCNEHHQDSDDEEDSCSDYFPDSHDEEEDNWGEYHQDSEEDSWGDYYQDSDEEDDNADQDSDEEDMQFLTFVISTLHSQAGMRLLFCKVLFISSTKYQQLEKKNWTFLTSYPQDINKSSRFGSSDSLFQHDSFEQYLSILSSQYSKALSATYH